MVRGDARRRRASSELKSRRRRDGGRVETAPSGAGGNATPGRVPGRRAGSGSRRAHVPVTTRVIDRIHISARLRCRVVCRTTRLTHLLSKLFSDFSNCQVLYEGTRMIRSRRWTSSTSAEPGAFFPTPPDPTPARPVRCPAPSSKTASRTPPASTASRFAPSR